MSPVPMYGHFPKCFFCCCCFIDSWIISHMYIVCLFYPVHSNSPSHFLGHLLTWPLPSPFFHVLAFPSFPSSLSSSFLSHPPPLVNLLNPVRAACWNVKWFCCIDLVLVSTAAVSSGSNGHVVFRTWRFVAFLLVLWLLHSFLTLSWDLPWSLVQM